MGMDDDEGEATTALAPVRDSSSLDQNRRSGDGKEIMFVKIDESKYL